jgi:riboflavin kinase/FMN adenylyltransferase
LTNLFLVKIVLGMHRFPTISSGTAVTIGNYDGVHRGHSAVISGLKEQAASQGLPTVVVVFEPMPKEYFAPDAAPARLTNLYEKMQRLQEQGVDWLIIQRFDAAFSSLSAEAWIEELLVKGLNAKLAVVGDDFRFGKRRCGDYGLLERSGAQYGFEVRDTASYCLGEQRVSSTAIRDALAANQLASAVKMLGRPYSVSGRIVEGDKRGRQLSFPTANVSLKRRNVALHGVFSVTATWRRRNGETGSANGVANVGVRPTVDGSKESLEVHLLDFDSDPDDGELYGARMSVTFCQYLRGEKKFESLNQLQNAIANDVVKAKEYFALNLGKMRV